MDSLFRSFEPPTTILVGAAALHTRRQLSVLRDKRTLGISMVIDCLYRHCFLGVIRLHLGTFSIGSSLSVSAGSRACTRFVMFSSSGRPVPLGRSFVQPVATTCSDQHKRHHLVQWLFRLPLDVHIDHSSLVSVRTIWASSLFANSFMPCLKSSTGELGHRIRKITSFCVQRESF